MSKPSDSARKAALLATMRLPAPLSYRLAPSNRKQRRTLARALRDAERKVRK